MPDAPNFLPRVLEELIVQYTMWGDPEYDNLPWWAEAYWKKYYNYTEVPLPSIFINGYQLLHNPHGGLQETGVSTIQCLAGSIYSRDIEHFEMYYRYLTYLPGTLLYHCSIGPAFYEWGARGEIKKYYLNGCKLSLAQWKNIKDDPSLWPSKKRKSLRRRFKVWADDKWKTISISNNLSSESLSVFEGFTE